MFDLNKKINKIKNNKKFIILITAFFIMSCGGNCDSLDKSFTSYDNAIELVRATNFKIEDRSRSALSNKFKLKMCSMIGVNLFSNFWFLSFNLLITTMVENNVIETKTKKYIEYNKNGFIQSLL